MDAITLMQQVEGWLEQQYAGRQTMSKDELATKAQGSSLPQDAKDAFQQLPQGDYTKDDLKTRMRDMMTTKVGGIGGMMGGDGGGPTGRGMR